VAFSAGFGFTVSRFSFGFVRARSGTPISMRPIDQTTVLVTGATDGLGRGVAERLADYGATVHLHGRDPERLELAAKQIRHSSNNDRVHTHLADLASLDQVRALAEEIKRSTEQLHVLVNNAGIGSGRPDLTTRQESRDGFELRFAVNYLAGFALTLRLLPLLRLSAPARVINVASIGQSPIDFDDPMLERAYGGSRAYGQSKLAQITSGFELAERLDPEEVTVNSLHPGTLMPTKIVLEQRGHSVDSLETGIEAVVRLAISPELEKVSGRFFDRQIESRADGQAYDQDARRRLRELSLELGGEIDSTPAQAPRIVGFRRSR
jgi:NAD(P)-dependent dehydrogenase (short-subunit alcohol dehydrogenase family)